MNICTYIHMQRHFEAEQAFLTQRFESRAHSQKGGRRRSICIDEKVLLSLEETIRRLSLKVTATQCNTLQHTATCCNMLHYTLQHTATQCNILWRTATHCNTLQHTATHCNTLQHTIRKHTRYAS